MTYLLTKRIDDDAEVVIAEGEDTLALIAFISKDLEQHIEESERADCRSFACRIASVLVNCPAKMIADGKNEIRPQITLPTIKVPKPEAGASTLGEG